MTSSRTPGSARVGPGRSGVRRWWAPAVVGLLAVLTTPFVITPAQAATHAPSLPGATPVLPAAKARIVVDAGTGQILSASNDRTRVPVASAIKLFTALTVHHLVEPADLVRISKRAASMPALKLPTKAGQRWSADGLLHSLLLASANDAAVALAERAGGGTTAGYEPLFEDEERALGLQDHPRIQDPAGLDDEFSVGGGNLISARDLAIVARAFLRQPDLAAITRLAEYRFPGGDGRQHRVVNHNRFLGSYAGAIGLKTGYTKRSGYTLVAAARRNGHVLIAIVVDSVNTVQEASQLLDAGFLQLRRGNAGLRSLPGAETIGKGGATKAATTTTIRPDRTQADDRRPPAVRASSGASSNDGWSAGGVLVAVAVVLATLAAAVALRRRAVVRRREAARRARARARRRAAAGRDAGPRTGPRPSGPASGKRPERSVRRR